MKPFVPYLRVVAGMFAAICLWLAVVELITGDAGQVLVQLLFAAGLGYLSVGKPLRAYLARRKAENAALAARAQAGHEAFLVGDPAAFAPPPPAPQRRPVRRGVLIAAGVAALFVLIGIVSDISDGLGDDSDGAGSLPTPAAAAPPAALAAPQPVAAPAPLARSVDPVVPAAPSLMPNVVCMNLQDAQDTIQAEGVYYSRSRDDTGRGRNQVLDRNWVVVSQSPSAGQPIGEGEAVLSAVKLGEPGDCS